MIGDSFPHDVTDSDYLSRLYRWRLTGERWEFQRTDVMRGFPFPVPPVRVSHIPEGIVWSRIARKYKTRYVNEPLRHYFDTPRSLSTDREFGQNAYLRMFYCRVVLDEHLDHFRYTPLDFMRVAENFLRSSHHLRESVFRSIGSLRNVGARMMCVVLLPVAMTLYHDDKNQFWRGALGRLARHVMRINSG